MRNDYKDIKEAIAEAAKKYSCSESDINLKDIVYPDEVVW